MINSYIRLSFFFARIFREIWIEVTFRKLFNIYSTRFFETIFNDG